MVIKRNGIGSGKLTKYFTAYLYLAPSFTMILIFLLYPLFNSFRYSFFQWDGVGKMSFIAITNYISIFKDAKFWVSFRANIIYILFFSFIPTLLGLIVSSIVARANIGGVRIFRTIFFTPQVIASVAVGTVFGWIYAPQFGVVNQLLGLVGLDSLQRAWLGSTATAPVAVGFIGVWLWTGFCIIIFIAGIQKIDEDFYASAQLDGANSLQQFFHITLPALKYEIVVVIIMTMIRALSTNVFGIVSAATGGAFGTRPISLYAYQLAFIQHDIGYASAVVTVLAIIVFLVSGLSMQIGERE